jgi:hypothetical protein
MRSCDSRVSGGLSKSANVLVCHQSNTYTEDPFLKQHLFFFMWPCALPWSGAPKVGAWWSRPVSLVVGPPLLVPPSLSFHHQLSIFTGSF